jgi:hypothetical protein
VVRTGKASDFIVTEPVRWSPGVGQEYEIHRLGQVRKKIGQRATYAGEGVIL